jgi:general secretion pathway protein G
VNPGVPLHNPRRRRAWTLIELLIGVAIVGLLAAIAVPSYLGYTQKARTADTIAKFRGMETRIESYRSEFGELPETLSAAIKPAPLDPWGNPYQYLNLGTVTPETQNQIRKDKNLHPLNTDYDLYSMGPDGDSKAPLTAKASRDDIIRANDGAFIGVAADY